MNAYRNFDRAAWGKDEFAAAQTAKSGFVTLNRERSDFVPKTIAGSNGEELVVLILDQYF